MNEIKVILDTFLLSSSTVFMFSIQTASTGPSKISHLRSGVCEDEQHLSDKLFYKLLKEHLEVSYVGR